MRMARGILLPGWLKRDSDVEGSAVAGLLFSLRMMIRRKIVTVSFRERSVFCQERGAVAMFVAKK